jgi:hypothetical protein
MKDWRGRWRFDEFLVGPNTIDSSLLFERLVATSRLAFMKDCELIDEHSTESADVRCCLAIRIDPH